MSASALLHLLRSSAPSHPCGSEAQVALCFLMNGVSSSSPKHGLESPQEPLSPGNSHVEGHCWSWGLLPGLAFHVCRDTSQQPASTKPSSPVGPVQPKLRSAHQHSTAVLRTGSARVICSTKCTELSLRVQHARQSTSSAHHLWYKCSHPATVVTSASVCITAVLSS